MNDRLKESVWNFLDPLHKSHQPVLLGFSGGPDSLALFHLLIEYRQEHAGFSFDVAHIDHGWRTESREEARQIAAFAKEMGMQAHIKTLQPDQMKGNLEAACREERLRFFSALCQEHGYQAVLLGHHADDAAETVLKRVLEGVCLPHLCGLRPCHDVFGVQLWRPLLSISKVEIMRWLDKKGLKGFQDSTNKDPRFLRARFRTRVLPHLAAEFGKEISQSLSHIGSEAGELSDYLNEKIRPFLERTVIGVFGRFLDLSADCPSALFEIKHLIRRFCEESSFSMSRESVDLAASFLVDNVANKQLEMRSHTLYIDRRRLFATSQDLKQLPKEKRTLCEDESLIFGDWRVLVTSCQAPIDPTCSSWKTLWCGQGEVVLPKGNYELSIPCVNQFYPSGSPLSKWWTAHRIPAFFRLAAPVIMENDRIFHEFLTGKSKPQDALDREWFKISLKNIGFAVEGE